MASQLTPNVEALRLFFNDDIYLVNTAIEKDVSAALNTILGEPEPLSLPQLETMETVTSPIEVHTAEVLIPAATQIDVQFIGKNKKNILILVNDATNKVSTETGAALLRNIVRAIGLQGDDFALVNYANYTNLSYLQLHDFFKCKLLLSFGVSAAQLSLNEMVLHQRLEYNETQMVFTHNLADLAADAVTKKVLWTSLQQLNNG